MGIVIPQLSPRPTTTATLWYTSQLAAALTRTLSPRVVSDLLPFVLLCYLYRNTNAFFLIMFCFRFQTCLKGSSWGPPPPKILILLQRQMCFSISFFLRFFISNAVDFRTKISPWPFTRQTVHCIHAFQCCCLPSITMVCCVSNNIYHLVSRSVATGLMEPVICYSAQITVIEKSSWEMLIY